MANSRVHVIKSPAEFQSLLEGTKSPPSLLVVDFFATWCGPCQMIAPAFLSLADRYPQASFAKVDVDKHQQIAQAHRVTAMPTFKFFKLGKEVDTLKGADLSGLEAKIKQHIEVKDGEGSFLASGSKETVNGYPDITENIDVANVECLNQQSNHSIRNAITPGLAYLESDVDEQLSIFFNFHQHCKIFAISLRCTSPTHRPKTLRFYINRPNAIDFDEAEGVDPTQEIELDETSYNEEGVAIVNLRFVKFQRVNTLSIFVVDNLGEEDTTRIEDLRLFGETMDVTRMSEIKKKEGSD